MLFHAACKYGKLNRSLSLVHKSPDASKAAKNEGEKDGEQKDPM
jgi:hypothetical protein